MLIEVPNVPVISASKLKTFRTCQRKYYYTYLLERNDRPEETKNVAALLGSGLHKAIDMYYKEQANPAMTFQEYMLNTYAEWEESGAEIKGEIFLAKSLKDGKDMLKKMDFDRWNPTDTEYKFTLPFPDAQKPIVMITGVIDIIDMSGDIGDHKSASRMPTQDRLDHDVQFLIYAWAYRQITGYPPNKVIWNHLRNGRLLEVNTAHNYDFKIEQLTYDIQALIDTKNGIAFNQRRILDDICVRECSFYTLCYGEKAPVVIDDLTTEE